MTEKVTFSQLRERYEILFIDAFGVLLTAEAPLPGAVEAIATMNREAYPYLILTNGCAKSLAATAERYRDLGLAIASTAVINSGCLLADYFQERKLKASRCAVLGTTASQAYVREAGGKLVDPRKDDFDVLVVANQTEFPFLETLDAVLSTLLRRQASGKTTHLVLPNPDLIYPQGAERFGFTAGALALLFEEALKTCFGPEVPVFDRLGKPFPLIFTKARQRAGGKKAIMIGDQLDTDIKGAQDAGLDTALFTGGLTSQQRLQQSPLQPTYILESWT